MPEPRRVVGSGEQRKGRLLSSSNFSGWLVASRSSKVMGWPGAHQTRTSSSARLFSTIRRSHSSTGSVVNVTPSQRPLPIAVC